MRLFLTSILLVSLLLIACKNESNQMTQIVLLKKAEREIRTENTDEKAIQYFDKLIQLKTVMEKAELRVLGSKQFDLPEDKKVGSKKLLRQDKAWKEFNQQRVIYTSRLKKHLRANYPEYKNLGTKHSENENSVPIKTLKTPEPKDLN